MCSAASLCTGRTQLKDELLPLQGNGAGDESSSDDGSDEGDSTSGGDAEDMETDDAAPADSRQQRPQPQRAAPPVLDDDGFQLVQRKGRR